MRRRPDRLSGPAAPTHRRDASGSAMQERPTRRWRPRVRRVSRSRASLTRASLRRAPRSRRSRPLARWLLRQWCIRNSPSRHPAQAICATSSTGRRRRARRCRLRSRRGSSRGSSRSGSRVCSLPRFTSRRFVPPRRGHSCRRHDRQRARRLRRLAVRSIPESTASPRTGYSEAARRTARPPSRSAISSSGSSRPMWKRQAGPSMRLDSRLRVTAVGSARLS